MKSTRRSWLRTSALAALGAVPVMAGTAAQLYVRGRGLPPAAGRLPDRERFPALGADAPATIYLDSAATTHRPQAVIDAQARFYVEDNANPARVHARARRAAERLSEARAAVARFLNAADPLEIVFTRGTTEAVNLAAASWGGANLRAGDEVIVTVAEHYSNLLPWTAAARRAGATVRVLEVDESGRLRRERLEALLSTRTRLVAFSHVSNVLGIVNPAQEIVETARRAGARVFIDGAQSAPHLGIDVQDLGCDFFAFSGHKLCGPMATGVLWARRELLEAMPPYHVGSNMAHEVTIEGDAVLEPGALKFQAGTPDVAGPVGLAAAVRYLESIGREALWAHDRALVARAQALADIPGVRVLGGLTVEPRVPVFSLTVDGWPVAKLAAALDARGIAVRGGDMAALPLLKRFGVTEALRASAYLYTAPEEIDRFVTALREITTR